MTERGSVRSSDGPEPAPPAPSAPKRPGRPLFYRDWRGVLMVAAAIFVVILLIPELRVWIWTTFVLPVVADVLGRRVLEFDGVRVEGAYPRAVEVASAAVFVLALVALRAVLLLRQAKGSYWARRITIDSSFILALMPFLGLGSVLAALQAGLLFEVPWAFMAVPPLIYGMIIGLVLFSLLFGLWIEDGGREHSYGRFILALLVFLTIDLFWVSVVGGTTRRLPLWAPPLAVAVAFCIYYGVTLGNRLLSHRRALFALGAFHVVFFATFLAVWVVEGPWPAMDWSFEGVEAVRSIGPADPWLFFLIVLPPVAFIIALGSMGQFLHRYAFWARPWLDGLNNAVVFALVLDAWATTVHVVDPFGALTETAPATDPLVAWGVQWLGGWGVGEVEP
jgi:uncharacterized membrane protein